MSQPTLAVSTGQSQIVVLTNQLRQQHGCAPLAVSPALSLAAQQHSQEMADNNYFSHVDLSGHNPGWRALQAGYAGSAGAENIAAGYTTAEEVVMAWYNETPPNDGHRQNLLNCSFTEIGIGYAVNPNSQYHNYWTQDFGRS
ncbi:MAG TPA: CAP domain-containing protein [Roseiflexaceae bacterium]|nr:CAP domain-containing protein [Roseiflexaceae bacterium]